MLEVCWNDRKHQFNFSIPSLLLLDVLVTCFLDAIRCLLKCFSPTKSSRKVHSLFSEKLHGISSAAACTCIPTKKMSQIPVCPAAAREPRLHQPHFNGAVSSQE
uniref:Uncharacterized protein n=1 Tax=Aegilops tauschii subsp. strangulata TaxID=200361 RepID=A0A453BI62_AEGTS